MVMPFTHLQKYAQYLHRTLIDLFIVRPYYCSMMNITKTDASILRPQHIEAQEHVVDYQDILDFWFHEIDPSDWFEPSKEFDDMLRARFTSVFNEVRDGKMAHWRETAEGRLAEIIVLDQFPRNIFRGTPQAFTGDEMALNLAREAISLNLDEKLTAEQKAFLYMPYMHSEDKRIHQYAVLLFAQNGLEEQLKFEKLHKKIIDRFGRYPHRNAILGRKSTDEELEFLETPNSSF